MFTHKMSCGAHSHLFYTNTNEKHSILECLHTLRYSSFCALLYMKVHNAFSALQKQCVFFLYTDSFVQKCRKKLGKR